MLMVTISTNLLLCVAGQTILKNLFSKILVIYIVCVALPLLRDASNNVFKYMYNIFIKSAMR